MYSSLNRNSSSQIRLHPISFCKGRRNMTAEIINLEKYRNEKLSQNKKNSGPRSKSKSDTSMSIGMQALSKEIKDLDNGDPI